ASAGSRRGRTRRARGRGSRPPPRRGRARGPRRRPGAGSSCRRRRGRRPARRRDRRRQPAAGSSIRRDGRGFGRRASHCPQDLSFPVVRPGYYAHTEEHGERLMRGGPRLGTTALWCVTLAIGAAGGFALDLLHVPLAWLLGSLGAVAAVGLAGYELAMPPG